MSTVDSEIVRVTLWDEYHTGRAMNPAGAVITKFGGVRPLARTLAQYLRKPVSPSQVSRWQLPRTAGGSGGMIPAKFHGPLLKLAKKHQVELSADDLVYR